MERSGNLQKDLPPPDVHGAVIAEQKTFFLAYGTCRIGPDVCVAEQIVHIRPEIIRNQCQSGTVGDAPFTDISVERIWIDVQLLGRFSLGDTLFSQEHLNSYSGMHWRVALSSCAV